MIFPDRVEGAGKEDLGFFPPPIAALGYSVVRFTVKGRT